MKLMVISRGTLFISQAKSLEPAGGWHSLHAGRETLWVWAVARPCCAVPMPALCMGKRSGKARLSPASLSPQTCLPQTTGFSPRAVATLSCELGSSLAPCPCSPSAPWKLDSVPRDGPLQDESSPGRARSPGGPRLAPRSPGGPRLAPRSPRGPCPAPRSPGGPCLAPRLVAAGG